VKDSRRTLSSWVGIGNESKYEIHVTSETSFELLEDQNSEDYEIAEKAEIKSYQAPINDSETIIPCFDKFVKLDRLETLKPNSFISVIGVIISVEHNLKDIITRANPGEILKLKNFKLTDTTNREVNCAVWGQEAIIFGYEPGTILKIEEAKLTTYGGYSLSILRHSRIQDISHLPVSSVLKVLWSKHYLNPKCKHVSNEP
jgi:hypothetical protein